MSGVPRGHWAESQKRQWCYRELGENVTVITCESKKKYRFCQLGDILIDDRRRAGTSWEQSGGIFIHHKSARETIERLQILMRTNRDTLIEGFSEAMREDRPICSDEVVMTQPGSLVGMLSSSFDVVERVSQPTAEGVIKPSSLLDSKLQFRGTSLEMIVVNEASCNTLCSIGGKGGKRHKVDIVGCMNGASAVIDETAVIDNYGEGDIRDPLQLDTGTDRKNEKMFAEQSDFILGERNRSKKKKSTVHADLDLRNTHRNAAISTPTPHCETRQALHKSAAQTHPMGLPSYSHDVREAVSPYPSCADGDVRVRIDTSMIPDTNPTQPHNPKVTALADPPSISYECQSKPNRRSERRSIESDDDFHANGRSIKDVCGVSEVPPRDAVTLQSRDIQVMDEISSHESTDVISDYRETVDCLVMLLSFHLISGSSSIFGQNKEFLAIFSGNDSVKSVCSVQYVLDDLGWERDLRRDSTAAVYAQRYGAFQFDEDSTVNDDIRTNGKQWVRLVYLEYCLGDDRKVLRQVDVEKYIEGSVREWGSTRNEGRGHTECEGWRGEGDGEASASRADSEDSGRGTSRGENVDVKNIMLQA